MGIFKEISFSNQQVIKFSGLPFVTALYLKIPHFFIKVTAILLQEFYVIFSHSVHHFFICDRLVEAKTGFLV